MWENLWEFLGTWMYFSSLCIFNQKRKKFDMCIQREHNSSTQQRVLLRKAQCLIVGMDIDDHQQALQQFSLYGAEKASVGSNKAEAVVLNWEKQQCSLWARDESLPLKKSAQLS